MKYQLFVRNLSVTSMDVVVHCLVKQHVHQRKIHSVTKEMVGVELLTLTRMHKLALLTTSNKVVELALRMV